jgi:hypothetical protein
MDDLEEPVRDIAATPSPDQGLRVRGHDPAPRVGTPQSTTVPQLQRPPEASNSPRDYYNAGEEQSVGGSSHGTLAYIQLDAYNVDPKELFDLHDTQKDAISRIVRAQVFPRVKFLPKSGKVHEKIFGTFWKPDLLVNTPRYIDAILDNFPDLKQRREDELQLTDAVHFWMKASPMVRQVILDRRSNVTQRMKRELVIGTYQKFFIHVSVQMLIIISFLLICMI